MVRTTLALMGAALLAGEAQAQSVDWSRSGGALFFSSAAAQATGAEPAAAPPRPSVARQPFDEAVTAAAHDQGLDPKLLHALVAVESAYRPDALSVVRGGPGAGGLTQLMPATAKALGVADRFDPVQNLQGGARYLAEQIRAFGDLRLALAAYNAGPARVAPLRRVPEFPETQAYVVKVVDCYLALAAGRSIRSARDCPGAEAVR